MATVIYKADESNCGMGAFHYLEDTETVMMEKIADAIEWDNLAIIQFSDADAFQNGKAIAAFIRRYKLGTIRSTSALNENSGHIITAYLWKVNRKAVRQWLERHRAKIDKLEQKKGKR